MHRKKSETFSKKRGYLLHSLVLLVCVLLVLSVASCSLDNTRYKSTFKIHMFDGSIQVDKTDIPAYYPRSYNIFMEMEDLPADEKILWTGACYSTDNPEPDTTDYLIIFDESDSNIQERDWSKDRTVIWGCMSFTHLTPGMTYYIRGYVMTDKAEYYTETIELRSEFNIPLQNDPDDYEIPVVFHLFPDEDGVYPVKESMIAEMISYANHVYADYFRIPKQKRADVRFVPATHDIVGNPLQTPGIVYEKESITIDGENPQLDSQYIWDMEKVLNVWVCNIESTTPNLSGLSNMPYFDSDNLLKGCDEIEPGCFAGIFLNAEIYRNFGNAYVFAHEAGHFLGLDHVFLEDYCDDTPQYDFDAFMAEQDWEYNLERSNGTEKWWSDNIMDYDPGFMTGITPDQAGRIQHTLKHAYFIPGGEVKDVPKLRSADSALHFGQVVY